MSRKVAHTAEVIANLRVQQTDTIAALAGIPTGETISRRAFSEIDSTARRPRPARPRAMTMRASTPCTALYQRAKAIQPGLRTRDLSQSYHDLTRRLRRQRYRQHAFVTLLMGVVMGIGLTVI